MKLLLNYFDVHAEPTGLGSFRLRRGLSVEVSTNNKIFY
jgi:hypothetical protein